MTRDYATKLMFALLGALLLWIGAAFAAKPYGRLEAGCYRSSDAQAISAMRSIGVQPCR